MTTSQRFAFGKNWTSFATTSLDPEKIAQARTDFERLTDGITLEGKTFLDIGFGQGLTLCLAAEKDAAAQGLDIDSDNLPALEATSKHFGLPAPPTVTVGSILDNDLVSSLQQQGGFDVVHSWGVLHHTGNMKRAIINAASLVQEDGIFILSIYNTHWSSPAWKQIKRFYNWAPSLVQRVMIGVFYWVIYVAKFLVTGKDPKQKNRGMNFYHDVVDWVGGYPYEYATAAEIKELVESLGFRQCYVNYAKVPTACNEFVFVKGKFDTSHEM